jgi:Tetratricopeptide repeat
LLCKPLRQPSLADGSDIVILHKPLSRFHLQLAHYVFAGVLLIRVVVLARLTISPYLLPTRGDMHFYDDWAQRILSGQFIDHMAFYGLPGYAYLLAVLYKLAGYGPFVPALLQALLDAGTAVLVYKVSVGIFPGIGARRAQIAGLVAAMGWALFVPAQTYAAILMPTACVVFIFWLILWRIISHKNAPTAWEALILGLLVGLTATAIATILFLIPLLIGAIVLKPTVSTHSQFSTRTSALALLFLGAVVGTSPCWVHNCLIARDRVILSAHSGINFWIGNNPSANGYPRFPPGLRAGQAAMLQDSIDTAESAVGHPLKRGEVSHYWSAKARDYIERDPAGWLRLLVLKFRTFWSAFQYDDLSIITILREQRVTFPGIYFGLVAAFALPAMVLGWKTAPAGRWVTSAIVLQMLALLPVFTTERYRLSVVPGLLVFAASGLVMFFNNVAAGSFRPSLAYIVLLAVSTIFVSWPQRDPSLWALDAYNSGWQALESNNLALAEKKLAVAYAYVPANSETLFALGNLRLAQQKTDDALAFYWAVLSIDPKHKGALNNLGVIALDARDYANAESWFRQAAQIDPANAKTHFLLAKTFLGKGNREAAQAEIDAALRLKPDQPEFRTLSEQIKVGSP